MIKFNANRPLSQYEPDSDSSSDSSASDSESEDDEDEDGDYFLDSGIGTSMESGNGSRPGSVRKRRGRGSFRE